MQLCLRQTLQIRTLTDDKILNDDKITCNEIKTPLNNIMTTVTITKT